MRIGLAGAGLIGQRHIAAMRQVSDVRLAAVLDPVAPADNTLPFVADLKSLIAQSDGVILAVPNHLHLPMAQSVLRAGLPVLVEKPLADTAENASKIAAVSEKTEVPVLVGHHRRHNPLIAKAKQIISDGTLGPLTAIHGQCWLPKPDAYFAQSWRQGTGAGPLFINMIHDIDLLMHLCGPITAVQAMQSNTQRGAQAEEVAVAVLQFASGALGTVTVSDVSLAPWSWELTAGENPAYPKTDENSYLISGTKGSIALPNLTVWSQDNGPDWWAPITTTRLPIAHTDPLVAQIAHFADVIAGKAAPLVSAQDGLRAVQVVEGIKQAAITGTAITID